MKELKKQMQDACSKLQQIQIRMVKNKYDWELAESLLDKETDEDFKALVKIEMQNRNQN